jgi:iron complex transport system permease protein
VRAGPFSAVVRPRAVAVPAALAAVTVLLLAVNVGRGDYPIGLLDVLRTLLGGGDEFDRLAVIEWRLPRSLTCVLVGAALGIAGAITQSITRNPLATPDVLGVTSGAAAAAVSVIVVTGRYGATSGAAATIGVPLAVLAGGLLAAAAVYALAWRRGLDGYRLVLVGLGVGGSITSGGILTSITSWQLTLGEVTDIHRAVVWLTGSFNAAGWDHVRPVAVALLVLVPVALVLAFPLGALVYSDDTARGLGVPVDRARAALLLVAVLIASVATAAAGPVAFVGLIAPQVAQRLIRSAHPPMIGSAACGAGLVVGADLLARTAFGVELPAGVLTAAVGAPYLMYLLVRSNRRALV